MPDDLTELESELQRLRPRALHPAFAARLEGAGAPQLVRHAAMPVWLWPVLGAAAAFSLVALAWGWFGAKPIAPTAAVAGAPRLVPARAMNVLYEASAGALVRLDDQTTARPVRLRYVDTVTWRDPTGRASLECAVPREDVILVPVVAY